MESILINIIELPRFFTPCALLALGLFVFLSKNPYRSFAVLTIVSVSLGYAFLMKFGFYWRITYVLALMTLLATALSDVKFSIPRSTTFKYLGIFFAYSIFSMVWTFKAPYLGMRIEGGMLHGLTVRTLIQNFQLFLMMFIFYVTFDYCRDQVRFRKILYLFKIATFVAICYAGYMMVCLYFRNIPLLNVGGLLSGESSGTPYRIACENRWGAGGPICRAQGYFGEPAWLASYLLAAVPLLCAEIFQAGKKALSSLDLSLLVASLFMLILTASQGALFIAALAIVWLCLIFRRTKILLVISGVTLAAVLPLGLLIKSTEQPSVSLVSTEMAQSVAGEYRSGKARESIIDRSYDAISRIFSNKGSSNINRRSSTWIVYMDIFYQHWIFGVGLGNAPFWFETDIVEPLNMYIRILVELGVIGLFIYLRLILDLTWRLYKLFRLRNQNREIFLYAIFSMVALWATLAQRMTYDALTNDPLVWVVVGVAAAVPYLNKGPICDNLNNLPG